MRPVSCLGLVALAGLAGAVAPARAEVYVRTPFVTVRVGRPCPTAAPAVFVRVPFVTVSVGGPVASAPVPLTPTVAQPPAAPFVPGEPPPLPVDPAPAPVPARAPTLSEFAGSFRPAPGSYEVVVEHPVTRQPVTVRFTLPPGAPPKVRVSRQRLEFRYRHHSVVIRFLRDGSVRVRG